MNRKFIKDGLGWGIGLWLFGYILGIILFMMVPKQLIGWLIIPVGIAITLWVLVKKIKSKVLTYYLIIGIAWLFIAVLLDYFFLVKLFKPADNYYKLDVYIYYLLTLVLPIGVGLYKSCDGKK